MRENFTNSEINHVSVINRQLTTLQNWLNTCTESALEYCNPDNGTANIDFDDYEMDIVFKFSLGESDESFNAVNEYDNRIAVISKRAKPMLGPDMDAINWNEHIPMIGEFRNIHFCYLFHELLEHQLQCDWNALLRIGEIGVEHILTMQRMMYWNDPPLPEGYFKNEKRSVFSSAPLPHPYNAYRPHASAEFLCIRILNENAKYAERWSHAQARGMGCAYLDDWRHKGSAESPGNHIDYALLMNTDCILSAHHSEYCSDEDNILLSVQDVLPKKEEFIFGSPRNPLQREDYWHFRECGVISQYGQYCRENSMSPPNNDDWRFCELFNRIHDGLDDDWHRTLCIGGLWLDGSLKQRCNVAHLEMENDSHDAR